MLGKEGPERVPIYDGSIYFADLLPQYAGHWQDRFKAEIDAGLRAGHRAFKLKIGRGHKWMDRPAGDTRDVQVLELARRHAGEEVLLAVDANDGYDLQGAKRFLERAGGLKLAFVEELFDEQVEQCLELKRFMAGHGWRTLLADGETLHNLDAFRPFIAAKAIDVLGRHELLRDRRHPPRRHGQAAGPGRGPAQLGFPGRLLSQLHVGRAGAQFLPCRARSLGRRRPGRQGLHDQGRVSAGCPMPRVSAWRSTRTSSSS